MARTVNIGCQDFEQMMLHQDFYVDKTGFIKEWWENRDTVTLITRPRRFGKTLTMDMVEKFFSVNYRNRGDLFERLSIWKEDRYRSLQGTYPVIFLSFAGIKETTFEETRRQIGQVLTTLYNKYCFLLEGNLLSQQEKEQFQKISPEMESYAASASIHLLTGYLSRYYGKKVIILLDEYDTPMQEAYLNGYWEELVAFIRGLFNFTFKTNPYLERALMTGITRISKESIFSDLNNLMVVTTTSEEYWDCFGFTEEEVFAALEEYGLSERKQEVKAWYDGFIFGEHPDIYNPWSIINYLKIGKAKPYWTNTSSNSLIEKLIREGNKKIKQDFEVLLSGETIQTRIEEQIVFNQLDYDETAVWSMLLASGYLKVISYEEMGEVTDWLGVTEPKYELALTNREVWMMFRIIIAKWFRGAVSQDYNAFLTALLEDDMEAMNEYMNEVALLSFSSFDTGGKSEGKIEPERFYHGFVLGLMVDLADRYVLTSNRESGFGRYDIMLEPMNLTDTNYKEKNYAIIIEFKVRNPKKEASLEETVQTALKQIEEKQYEATWKAKGFPEEQIRKYGFAFEGKKVLIGKGKS